MIGNSVKTIMGDYVKVAEGKDIQQPSTMKTVEVIMVKRYVLRI